MYDGTQKTGVAAGNDYTVSNGTGTTVGGYTATVSLTDKANTVWQHAKTNADQGIGWSIAPKPIPVPQPITGLVYDGAEKTGVAAGNGYTVSNGIGINAGSYTAKASLTDKMNTVWQGTNGSNADQDIGWSIGQKTVSAPIDKIRSLPYDGFLHTWEGYTSNVYPGVDIGGVTSATDAGTYSVTFTPQQPNYCFANSSTTTVTEEWVISQYGLPVPTAKGPLVYNEQEQKGVPDGYGYVFLNKSNLGTNAGTYTATAQLANATNFFWIDSTGGKADKLISWSIAPKPIDVPQAVAGLVWDGTEKIGVTASKYYTLSGETSGTAARSYTAYATLNDQANTMWAGGGTEVKQIDWSIAQRAVADPQKTKWPLLADGQPKSGYLPGDFYTLTGVTSHDKMGHWQTTAELVDKANSYWESTKNTTDLQLAWTLYGPVSPPVMAANLVYNGQQQEGFTVALNSDAGAVSGTQVATDAGQYKASIQVNNTYPFLWTDTLTWANRDVSWSIAPKPIAQPAARKGIVEDGALKTGVPAGAGYAMTGNTATKAGSYTATATLLDSKNTVWAGTGGNAALLISWSIAAAPVTPAPEPPAPATPKPEHPSVTLIRRWRGKLLYTADDSGQQQTMRTVFQSRRWLDGIYALRLDLHEKDVPGKGKPYTLALPGSLVAQLTQLNTDLLDVNLGELRLRLNLHDILALSTFSPEGSLMVQLEETALDQLTEAEHKALAPAEPLHYALKAGFFWQPGADAEPAALAPEQLPNCGFEQVRGQHALSYLDWAQNSDRQPILAETILLGQGSGLYTVGKSK